MLQAASARRNLPPAPFWALPGPPSALQPPQPPRIVQLPGLEQLPGGGARRDPYARVCALLEALKVLSSQHCARVRLKQLLHGCMRWLVGLCVVAAAAAQASGGVRRMSALEARNLAWLAWARQVLGASHAEAKWEAEALAAAAQGLAAQTPYVVRLADVSIEVLPGCFSSNNGLSPALWLSGSAASSLSAKQRG
jgi:hypothetical protein